MTKCVSISSEAVLEQNGHCFADGKRINNSVRRGQQAKPFRHRRSKAYPLPHGVSPVSVPLIASQQGIHGKPCWAGTLSVLQSGAFSYCVTRFRGGALRHAKFPKTSYKVQLLDTLKHGRCVGQNRSRGRGLIFLSIKVLVPLGKTQAFCWFLLNLSLPDKVLAFCRVVSYHRKVELPSRGYSTIFWEISCGLGMTTSNHRNA